MCGREDEDECFDQYMVDGSFECVVDHVKNFPFAGRLSRAHSLHFALVRPHTTRTRRGLKSFRYPSLVCGAHKSIHNRGSRIRMAGGRRGKVERGLMGGSSDEIYCGYNRIFLGMLNNMPYSAAQSTRALLGPCRGYDVVMY